jgi:FKBP-type peptidyl-prolyl cis-trans isomerase SlyD
MDYATQVGPDTFVTLAYTLYGEDGDVLDSTDEDEPLSYLHGYGQIVAGLERRIEGMVRGDARSVVVPPAEAYGEYHREAVLEVERADFPDPASIVIGDEYVAESDDGEMLPMTVLEVNDDNCIVDTNHPLAGETLRYEVTVLDVRPATDSEIREAEEAILPELQLVNIGRKPRGCSQPS